jgi:hypothetical protein
MHSDMQSESTFQVFDERVESLSRIDACEKSAHGPHFFDEDQRQ